MNRNLRQGIIALVILAAVVSVVIYWRTAVEDTPGDYHVRKGNYRLEDGLYKDAVKEFKEALRINPEHKEAYLGLAIAYMYLGQYSQSEAAFNKAIDLDPEFAVAYADRGILYDRMGRHHEALEDYKKALALDPRLAKGPGWLWRFLRNIDKPPPTIADRARYLEAELKKPPEQRLLSVPEIDNKQRMYKY